MSRKWLVTLPLAVAAVLALLALGAAGGTAKGKKSKGKRTVYLSAVEYKGSAKVSEEPFPTSPLPAGDGYERKVPDATGKWEVETYRFDQPVIVVKKGEKVTLKIFGVNGKEHPLMFPSFDKEATVKRGEVTTMTFTARKRGIYQLHCHTHMPTMVLDVLVI